MHKLAQIPTGYFPYRLFFSSFIFLFSSCETVVELDLPEKQPGLVTNCFFNPDSIFSVNMSKSQYVLDNASVRKINNAVISLYRESVWIEDLGFISDGNYTSLKGNKPQAGINYKISVSADGFSSVEANDKIPAPTQITAVDTGTIFMENQKYFELKIKFKDNPSEKNYYQLQLFTKNYFQSYDSIGNPIMDTTSYFQPMGFESKDLIFDHEKNFGNSGAMFSDELFGAKGEYQLSIYTYTYSNEYDTMGNAYGFNELKILLKSVSENYYKYVVSYQLYQQSNGNPFSEPVQIYNNIKNGYGIFAGYSGTEWLIKLN